MNYIFNLVFQDKQGNVKGIFKTSGGAIPNVEDVIFVNDERVKVVSREFHFNKTNTTTIPVDEVNVIFIIE